MKRIKFDNLQSNWFFIALLLVSLVCIIFGFFEIIKFENPKINKAISTIGYLTQAVYVSRIFWYKNYIQWNKKGALIRIGSFLGESISFEDIKTVTFENNILTIFKNDGINLQYNLTDIDKNDSERLVNIINSHSN